MESKSIKVRYEKIEEAINKWSHFGWVFHSKSSGSEGQVVTVNLKRENKTKVHRHLVKLEKFYKKIVMPVPVGFIIWAILGAAALGAYLFLDYSWKFALLGTSIMFFGISIYLLITFIVLKAKSKSLIEAIFDQGDEYVGLKRTFPLKNNLEKPQEDSFILQSSILKKK